jgi:hypothetical protein
MSLPTKPSLLQIRDEFGVDTRNQLPKWSLREFYIAAIDDINPGVSRQSDFGGLGRPEGTTITPNSIGSEGINASLNVSFVGSPKGLTYYFKYWEGHGSPSGVQETSEGLASSTGDKNQLIIELEPSTDYSIQGVLYNPFNSHPFDHEELNVVQVTTDDPPISVPTPTITGVVYIGYDSTFGVSQYEISFNNGSNNSYEAQWREANTSDPWNGPNGLGSVTNDDTGVFNISGVSLFAREFRMRAVDGNNNTSNWSNVVVET